MLETGHGLTDGVGDHGKNDGVESRVDEGSQLLQGHEIVAGKVEAVASDGGPIRQSLGPEPPDVGVADEEPLGSRHGEPVPDHVVAAASC